MVKSSNLVSKTSHRTARFHTKAVLAAVLSLLACVCVGCSQPEAVAAFAGAANQALTQGASLFNDLQGSCLRRHTAVERVTPAFLPEPSPAVANACADFAPQGVALVQDANVLAAYFQAMQELAAFDNSSVSTPAEAAGANGATAADLNSSQIDSISKLSGLVTRAFTGNYRRNHLLEYLRDADPHVAVLTTGLENVVGKDYQGLLTEERRNLNIEYQRVFKPGDTALTLLLNRAYRGDIGELNRRQSAAVAYVQALQQIRQAHRKLAASARRLETKQVSVELEPYTKKLQDLLWPMKQIARDN